MRIIAHFAQQNSRRCIDKKNDNIKTSHTNLINK
jgi:hypothetical protein